MRLIDADKLIESFEDYIYEIMICEELCSPRLAVSHCIGLVEDAETMEEIDEGIK